MYNDRIMQLLARKNANEATDSELAELNALLEQYPDNLYYEEVLNQLWVQKTPANENDADEAYLKHLKRYESDFNDQSPERLQTGNVFALKYWLAAACLLAFSVIGVWYYRVSVMALSERTALTEIVTPKGVRKKIILPDGTQVWLNSNSKLGFDNNMNHKASRMVSLTGEAYFDVTKNKHKPFIIHTDKFSIKVLGTAFNVKSYTGDKKAEAALIRGKIELTVNDSLQEKFILRPNEKFVVTYTQPVTGSKQTLAEEQPHRKLVLEDINPVQIASKEYIKETSWVDNKLVFKNESFDELKPVLERWYNVKIIIQNDRVKQYHFTGVLQNESILQALTAMQIIRPFTFKIEKYDVKID